MNRFVAVPHALARPAVLTLGLGLGGLANAPLATAATVDIDQGSAPSPADVSGPAAPPVDVDSDIDRFIAEEEEASLGPGIVDPTKRRPPRRHRFRMAFELDYLRLSAAVDDEGVTQRFHYLPVQLDFAYQVQLFKVLMLRPSFALGGNPANTAEAMPAMIHPQIFGGYQGGAFGAALGYGYLHPFPVRKDVISDTRGGLGQPIVTANHALRVELSYTTNIDDRGALSFGLRLGGMKSHIRHYDLDERGWRFSVGLQLGWYFGGYAAEQRQRERRQQRKRNRGGDKRRDRTRR